MTPPIRVLVVDDTAVVRRLVTDVLASSEGIEVVGTASNGRHALQQIGLLAPDVVTLDVEMPVMDGITTLAELRHRWKHLPVIMFSTLTARGASATLDALTLGANDYVTKPSATRNREAALDSVRQSLVPLVHLWGAKHQRRTGVLGATPAPPAQAAPAPVEPTSRFSRGAEARPAAARAAAAPAPPAAPAAPQLPAAPQAARLEPVRIEPVRRPVVDLTSAPPAADGRTPSSSPVPVDKRAPLGVVIGVSTGGPQALQRVVPMLPRSLAVPILVVQHMPPVFTRLLAERLDSSSMVPVHESEDGMPVEPGHVYVAQGGVHLTVVIDKGVLVLRHDDGPPENSCRPAVDVTLRSAGEVWGSRTLTVIMTGMGSDGLLGARQLRRQGGSIYVQDEETSVVWGMPGAVERDGLAHKVLPLDDIAGAIVAATDRSSALSRLSRTGSR